MNFVLLNFCFSVCFAKFSRTVFLIEDRRQLHAASETSNIHRKSFVPELSTKEEHCDKNLILG